MNVRSCRGMRSLHGFAAALVSVALIVAFALWTGASPARAEGASTDASDNMELPSRELADAVTAGNLGGVHVALLHGMSPNDTGTDGIPAIVRAAEKGYEDIVNYLLGRGADADKTDRDGRTALGIVSQSGRADIAQILLQNEANPNKPSTNGDTPLMIAARAHRTEVIRVLLAFKADAGETDITGRTPLDLAKENHFDDIVGIFRQNGIE